MKYIIVCVTVFCGLLSIPFSGVHAEENPSNYEVPVGKLLRSISNGYVDSNSAYSKRMFDRQEHVSDKPALQLQERAANNLEEGKLYVGGRFIASHIAESTNTSGKFPILSRLPPSHPNVDSEDINVINDGSFNLTFNLPWVTAFAQREYTEVEYPGQSQWQWRKYFITVGDLKRSPFYLTVGKNTVNFGDMTSYSPFQHTMNVHYFWPQSDDGKALFELGYLKDGWHVAGTLMKGGRGLRVLNTPHSDRYDNFALNISKQLHFDADRHLKLGAGYLRGTIYDSTFAHHPPSTGLPDMDYSPAWDANATFTWGRWDVSGEVTRTLEDWPASDWPVTAFTLQTRWRDEVYGFPTSYSFGFSKGIQGDGGTEWERMVQVVTGIETELTANLSVGAEWVHSEGFVPLIAIRAASDRDVTADAFVMGTKLTF